jgi:hypothetical protein
MRRVLPLLAVLMMGFAPVPPYRPKPRPAKPAVVALPLLVLDVSEVAHQVMKKFGPRSGTAVTFDVSTNTLFLQGQQGDIDRVVKFIKDRDEAARSSRGR